jgi:hypothetical protein
MKLTKGTPRERSRSGEPEQRFRKLAPLVAGLAFSALTLLPMSASAQTYTCSAKRVDRPMEAFEAHKINRGKVTGLTMFVPAGKGKRIEVGVSDSYVNHLADRAKAAPEAERSSMLRAELRRTLEGGIAALGSKATATFNCEAAPAVPSAAPPAKTEPVKAPAPSAAPAAKAEPAKTAGPTISEPLPPRSKGGNGSDSTPYVIEIPVPRGTTKGQKIAETKLHVMSIGQEESSPSEKIYFSLKFVTEPNSDKAYRADVAKLSQSVSSLMASTATRHLRAKSRSAQAVSSSALNGNTLSTIRGMAQSHEETIGSYLGISSAPQQRRRTLGGI